MPLTACLLFSASTASSLVPTRATSFCVVILRAFASETKCCEVYVPKNFSCCGPQ